VVLALLTWQHNMVGRQFNRYMAVGRNEAEEKLTCGSHADRREVVVDPMVRLDFEL
jgi:hypothetical protein